MQTPAPGAFVHLPVRWARAGRTVTVIAQSMGTGPEYQGWHRPAEEMENAEDGYGAGRVAGEPAFTDPSGEKLLESVVTCLILGP